VHERHGSPCQSPCRSPERLRKPRKREEVKHGEMLNWDVAWHRDGLERPPFWTRFRAQSDSWVAPAHSAISIVALPAWLSRFCTKQVMEEGERCAERKNYTPQLRLHPFHHPELSPRNGQFKTCNHCACESHSGKNTKSGGSDPENLGTCRPNGARGRSRPAALGTVPGVFFTALRRVSETPKPRRPTCL